MGDNFRVDLAGPPYSPVTVLQTSNGVTGNPFTFGYTDGNGNFEIASTQPSSDVGVFTQIWSIGNAQATPVMNFVVAQDGMGGTLQSVDAGQTSDGSLTGISVITISNGTVSTYSDTELDYAASGLCP